MANVTRLSAPPQGNLPVTLGIGEPFMTTVTVSLVFALILFAAGPCWMQAYAFFMPAFRTYELRR